MQQRIECGDVCSHRCAARAKGALSGVMAAINVGLGNFSLLVRGPRARRKRHRIDGQKRARSPARAFASV